MNRLIATGLAVICLHAAVLWQVNVGIGHVPPPATPIVVLVTTDSLPTGQVADPVAVPVPGQARKLQPSAVPPHMTKELVQKPASRNTSTTEVPPAKHAANPSAEVDTPPPAGSAQAGGPAAMPMQTRERSAVSIDGGGTRSATPAIQLPSRDADYLNNPAPIYPAASRRLGERGKVVVRVLIGKDGSAHQGEILQSSGFERLDQAALRAVITSRYVPGQRAGIAQDMWFNVPVSFNLD